MWGLGCLVWESYNGPLRNKSNLKDINNVSNVAYIFFSSCFSIELSIQIRSVFVLQIPKSVTPLYCELVGANPTNRPNPADIITRCRKPEGFFKNELVDTLLFLEEIQIKDKAEKLRFFNTMTVQLDNFPKHVCK